MPQSGVPAPDKLWPDPPDFHIPIPPFIEMWAPRTNCQFWQCVNPSRLRTLRGRTRGGSMHIFRRNLISHPTFFPDGDRFLPSPHCFRILAPVSCIERFIGDLREPVRGEGRSDVRPGRHIPITPFQRHWPTVLVDALSEC